MSRSRYERPQIKRHAHNLGNDFGAARGRKSMPTFGGVAIEPLVQAHGSPLFVFSEATIRERAAAMRDAFTPLYPNVCFAWSYKTNHLDAVCSILHSEGWYAEVVSQAEYAMARRLGIPGDQIVFNGAYKPVAALQTAVEEGAFIQIDHFDEIDALELVASKRGAPVKVGIRVNMNLEALGSTWDRFGFNLDAGEAKDAIRRIHDGGLLRVVGVHVHLGTYIDIPDAYGEAVAKLVELTEFVERTGRQRLEVINLGGGFPSANHLMPRYEHGEDTLPSFREYAAQICGPLARAFGDRADPPLLVLESGRALVDASGVLVATVVGVRRVSTSERGLVLDAGVNLLYTSTWYRHEIIPTEVVPGELERSVLFGPLCMRIDVVRASVTLPPLDVGHRIAIQNVGAYNVTQWMQFSQMRPAILLIGPAGQVDVIRRAETIADLKDLERRPDRLTVTPSPGTKLPR